MNIYSITFSPTGTSDRISDGILTGISATLDANYIRMNLTYNQLEETRFNPEDIVIVCAPVYGGKTAPLFKQRLSGISGNGARCIVVAVYGNRAFESAVTDLSNFMTENGFTVCGAAAFIGEHSYSTKSTPIAEGRPDTEDIGDAERFGNSIADKIRTGHPTFRVIRQSCRA